MIPYLLAEWLKFAEGHPLWLEHTRSGSLHAAARLVAAFAHWANPTCSRKSWGVLTKGGGTHGIVPGIGPCAIDCIKFGLTLENEEAERETGIVKLIRSTGDPQAAALFWNAGEDGTGLPKRAGDNWGVPTYQQDPTQPAPEPDPTEPPGPPLQVVLDRLSALEAAMQARQAEVLAGLQQTQVAAREARAAAEAVALRPAPKYAGSLWGMKVVLKPEP